MFYNQKHIHIARLTKYFSRRVRSTVDQDKDQIFFILFIRPLIDSLNVSYMIVTFWMGTNALVISYSCNVLMNLNFC